jgi:hypothetical protein
MRLLPIEDPNQLLAKGLGRFAHPLTLCANWHGQLISLCHRFDGVTSTSQHCATTRSVLAPECAVTVRAGRPARVNFPLAQLPL